MLYSCYIVTIIFIVVVVVVAFVGLGFELGYYKFSTNYSNHTNK